MLNSDLMTVFVDDTEISHYLMMHINDSGNMTPSQEHVCGVGADVIDNLRRLVKKQEQDIIKLQAMCDFYTNSSVLEQKAEYSEELLLSEFRAAWFLTQDETENINEAKLTRAFANRILMRWGDKEGCFQAMLTASKMHIKNSMPLWQVDAYGNEWTCTYFIRSKDKSNAINAVRQKYYDNDDNVRFGAEIVNDDENNIFGE